MALSNGYLPQPVQAIKRALTSPDGAYDRTKRCDVRSGMASASASSRFPLTQTEEMNSA